MADVLLIHGFLNTPDLYQPLYDALSVEWHVESPIAPGHSAPLGHPFRLTEWVDALTELLDEQDHVALVGHSAGGHVASLAAAVRPDVVSGIVTLDSPPVARRDLMSGDAAHTYVNGLLADNPHLADVVHYLIHNDLDSLFGGFEENLLKVKLDIPVLMVGADPDVGSLLTQQLIDAAQQSWTDVRSATLEGVGHLLGIENGDVSGLMTQIGPFLREVLTGP